MGLIILCLLVYIPGLWQLPPIDRDESRFAQASRQMLESDTLEGWVVPKVQDRPRLNKPPLIYWLQASSAGILGDRPGQWRWLDGGSENIWVYRLPSVFSALAAVLLTWRLGLKMFDPRAAWLAAALLAVCPVVVFDAHQARADQLLLAMTAATMLALWHVWSRAATKRRSDEATKGPGIPPYTSPPRKRRSSSSFLPALAFWLFLALGIMTKGPITPMIAALTCLSLSLISRNFSWLLKLRPALGLLIVLAVVGPWVYLVGQSVGWSKYLSIVYDETIGRSAGAKEGHWGPPGYHIVLLGVLFWPGSLLTAAAIGRAWKRGLRPSSPNPPTTSRERQRAGSFSFLSSFRNFLASSLRRFISSRPSRPAELFLLAWMLPSWLVFELVSTKLPHYTMPLYPAVALMSARALFGVKAMFLPALNAAQRSKLAAFLATREVKCPKCKYNLKGLVATKCPECHLELRTGSNRLFVGPTNDPGLRVGRFIWFVTGVCILVAIPEALSLFGLQRIELSTGQWPTVAWLPEVVIPGFIAALGCLVLLGVVMRLLRREAYVNATLTAIAASVLLFISLLGFMLPRTPEPWISKRIADVLHQHNWTPQIPIACVGYAEDSLIFLTRGQIVRLSSVDESLEWVKTRECSVLIASEGDCLRHVLHLSSLSGAPTSPRRQFEQWGSIRGFNYSTGDRSTVAIQESYFVP